ncbi:unnamed protein product [Dracunculus medinensis]|uniref:Aspartyl aminopeptidase n=1 Tax=Dracunculus medinensis TaxID=318479 RepID=A0A0N4U9Y9_DRAME|nr:unnamed protein product [Dracunculus medinensis]
MEQMDCEDMSTAIINKTNILKVAKDFVDFLNRSVTPFHAVNECKKYLKNANFQELSESDVWTIEPLKKYFVTKNSSTILAFAVGGKYRPGNGYSVTAAHTDSPSLRLKPTSKLQNDKFLQIGVSTYGGGLWRTWFDRDLSVAGLVIREKDDRIIRELVNISKPILYIPSLAIHFSTGSDRNKFEPNVETNLRPILATMIAENINKNVYNYDQAIDWGYTTNDHHISLLKLIADEIGCKIEEIIDLDLYLYDHQPAVIGGIYNEFISGQRLDNLVGTYACISGLLMSIDSLVNDENIRIAACFDNEECGSRSAQGAGGQFTEWVLRRLAAGGSPVAFEESIAKSMIMSFDQAHCSHPNYGDKHEDKHRPAFHEGVVVKVNHDQRYSTTPTTFAILKKISRSANIPLQNYVVRNDMPCGSTIGPILSSKLGIQSIDVGCAQLAMHSIREMTCTSSIYHAVHLCSAFYKKLPSVLASLQ